MYSDTIYLDTFRNLPFVQRLDAHCEFLQFPILSYRQNWAYLARIGIFKKYNF